jgi:4-oxalocrotonate tautomerase
MPTIFVEGPPIDMERKRRLVKEIYDTAAEVYGLKHITVIIRENAPENVGVAGQLLADRRRN